MPFNLQDLRDNEKTSAICLAAVQENGFALKYVPADKKTEAICLAAVQQNGFALQYIPADKRTEAICLAAVKQDSLAMKLVPADKKTEAIYLAMVQQDGLGLESVPDDKKTQAICLAAIQQNGLALEHIPAHQRSEAFCLAAIQQNSGAWEHIPSAKITESFCLAAVQLKPPQFDILYNILQRLNQPKENNPVFEAIKNILLHTEHVILTSSNDDPEIKDGWKVYANHPKRVDKTLYIDDPNKLDDLFRMLQRYNNNKNINLVLLGHNNRESEQLAGMSVNNIVSTCQQHRNINRVTLLGCHSAKSQPADAELEKIRALQKIEMEEKDSRASIQSAVNVDMQSEQFQKNCLKLLSPKPGANANSEIYIINKIIVDKEPPKFQLLQVCINPETPNTVKATIITDDMGVEAKASIAKLVGKNDFGKISFPKNSDTMNMVKTDIQHDGIQKIKGTAIPYRRFHRLHPDYKKDKETLPFLTSVEMSEEEASRKLQESFLQKLFLALKKENIQRPITLKGYLEAVHVDTFEGRFHITKTHLYSSKGYEQGQDRKNIDFLKLGNEHKKKIEAMTERKPEELSESTAKAIKITINKP